MLAQTFFWKCFGLCFFLTYFKSFHFTLNDLSSIHQSLLVRSTDLCPTAPKKIHSQDLHYTPYMHIKGITATYPIKYQVIRKSLRVDIKTSKWSWHVYEIYENMNQPPLKETSWKHWCKVTQMAADCYLLILDFTGLNPCLNLVSIPLELLYFLLQICFKLFLLVRIVSVVNLNIPFEEAENSSIKWTTKKKNAKFVFHKSNNKCLTLFQMLSKMSTPSWTFFNTRSISPWSFRLAPIEDDEVNSLQQLIKIENDSDHSTHSFPTPFRVLGFCSL